MGHDIWPGRKEVQEEGDHDFRGLGMKRGKGGSKNIGHK